MIKLDRIKSRQGFVPACEYWNIDEDIKISITRLNCYAHINFKRKGDIAY